MRKRTYALNQAPTARRAPTTPRAAAASPVWLAWLACAVWLCACSARPPEPPPPADVLMGPPLSLLEVTEESVHEVTAPGITLHVQRKPERGLVSLQLWLRAGAQLEVAGERGAATTLPLMLMGDERDPTSLIAQLKRLGAQARAWTSADRAVLEVTLTPEGLPEGLSLLARAVRAPRWGEEALTHAKRQVISHQERARSWVGRRLLDRLLNDLYGGHPSGRPVTPATAEVEALSLEGARAFYNATYTPTSAYLICVGPIEEGSLRALVDEAWRGWRGGADEREATSAPPRPRPTPPPLDLSASRGPSVEVEVAESGKAQALLAFPVNELTPEAVAYLDLLGLLLTGEGDGALQQAGRRAGLELTGARVFPVTPDGPGAFVLSAEVPANEIDALWRVLLEQLSDLRARPPRLSALEQAKLVFERESARSNETLSSQARRLGFFAVRWPQEDALLRYARAISQARPEAISSFLRELITPRRLHAIVRSPAPEGVSAELWSERLRELAALIMDQRRVDLRPGLNALNSNTSLLFDPAKMDGVVTVRAVVPVRPRLSRPTELSLGHWLAAQLSERQLHEPAFSAQYNGESITLSATIAATQLDDAIAGLIQRLRQPPIRTEPSWSSDALERARLSALSALSLTRYQPWQRLRHLERRALMAFDAPPLPSPHERRGALQELGSSSLTRWYQEHIQSAPALITVSGDVTAAQLSRALSPLTSSASVAHAPMAEGALRPPLPGSALKECRGVQESTDHARAWLSLTFDLRELPADDWAALSLIEAALTGPLLGLNTRLSAEAEGDRLRAQAQRAGQPPRLSLSVEVKPAGTEAATRAIREAIERLQSAPLSADELRQLRSYARASHAHLMSTTASRAGWVSRMWLAGWRGAESADGVRKAWERQLEGVTAEGLRRVAREALNLTAAVEALVAPPDAKRGLAGCREVSP
jgi:zinc protease